MSPCSNLLAVLVAVLCVLHRPCAAQEAGSEATAYQQRLQVLDEQAQGLAKKRYSEARGGPKLTADEGAEWLAVTGELHEINPYWRFHRQLVEDIAAMTESLVSLRVSSRCSQSASFGRAGQAAGFARRARLHPAQASPPVAPRRLTTRSSEQAKAVSLFLHSTPCVALACR